MRASRNRAPARKARPATRRAAPRKLDPVLISVMANRMDGIVREMTNTLLRAARSAVISSARDFSCCIVTGDNQLLASAEGLPVHIFGAHLQTARFCREHEDDITLCDLTGTGVQDTAIANLAYRRAIENGAWRSIDTREASGE